MDEGPRARKVRGRPVTWAEWELTRAVLGAFNAAAGTQFTPGAHFVPVVGRIREHPDMTAADHERVIAASFADPWWQDPVPGVQVIYGSRAQFERQLERARSRRAARPGRPVLRTDAQRAADDLAVLETVMEVTPA